MYGPGDHHIKWSQTEEDKHLLVSLTSDPDGLTDETETDLENELAVTKGGGCREGHTGESPRSHLGGSHLSNAPPARPQPPCSLPQQSDRLRRKPDAALPGAEPAPPGWRTRGVIVPVATQCSGLCSSSPDTCLGLKLHSEGTLPHTSGTSVPAWKPLHSRQDLAQEQERVWNPYAPETHAL